MTKRLFGVCILCLLVSNIHAKEPTWQLVWSDEFEYEGLPDETRWGYEEGFIRNRELQYYTHSTKNNARVEGGMLVIEARKEKLHNTAFDSAHQTTDWTQSRNTIEYTSASITTRGKASWLYGRIEVRAKLPTGRGMWPAIWMLGANIGAVGWPSCGEIDIMENVGFAPDLVHGNIHTRKYNHVQGTNKGSTITIAKPYHSFHVYAITWNKDRIEFFVDDRKYYTFTNDGTGTDAWPFAKKHYLILNIAVGGSWGGQNGVDPSIFPQRMYVDYVRIYQNKAGQQPGKH